MEDILFNKQNKTLFFPIMRSAFLILLGWEKLYILTLTPPANFRDSTKPLLYLYVSRQVTLLYKETYVEYLLDLLRNYP